MYRLIVAKRCKAVAICGLKVAIRLESGAMLVVIATVWIRGATILLCGAADKSTLRRRKLIGGPAT
jgi:hypothetical protein